MTNQCHPRIPSSCALSDTVISSSILMICQSGSPIGKQQTCISFQNSSFKLKLAMLNHTKNLHPSSAQFHYLFVILKDLPSFHASFLASDAPRGSRARFACTSTCLISASKGLLFCHSLSQTLFWMSRNALSERERALRDFSKNGYDVLIVVSFVKIYVSHIFPPFC